MLLKEDQRGGLLRIVQPSKTSPRRPIIDVQRLLSRGAG
ncbi:MAG: hypothetical protein ACI86M_003492 [Saprospiraceae bacterium]